MASEKHVFEEWLSEKLKSLELDTDIYVDYFCSVLDETQTDNEIKESLQDILEGVLVRLEIIKFGTKYHTTSTYLGT